MPPSAPEPADGGQSLAVAAEALFLANLMVAPGLAFLAILWLYRKHGKAGPRLARCHVIQTFEASIWAGALLVVAVLALLAAGGVQSAWTWVIVILWFTCVHSSLILLGVVGLVKAMAGKKWVFPLVGRRCE